MKALISTVLTSLSKRSGEQVIGGPGEGLLSNNPALNGVFTNATSVEILSPTSLNSKTTYNPLLSRCKGTLTSRHSHEDCLLVQKDGKHCALAVTKKRQEERMSKGVKYDDQKPALAYIPKAALDAEGKAFSYGASKYAAWNYKNGIAVTRTLSAALRHIYQFLSGEDIDKESGVPHLGCARANIAMALDTLEHAPQFDDRFKK